TLAAWCKYWHACELCLHLDPPAPGDFDTYACWGDAAPNSTVTVPCPWYLPCGRPGCWSTPWATPSPSLPSSWHCCCFCSSGTCTGAPWVLPPTAPHPCRHLHCTCNFIHANLFLSFVLQAGAILTWDALLQRRLCPGPGKTQVLSLWRRLLLGCQLAQALTQYCVGGLFLHKLLVLAAFSISHTIPPGAPVLFVVPWVVVRYLYENKGCWERNKKAAVWWIIRCPILMAVAVNFVVFVCIVRILVAKVRAHQVSHGDTRVRLARSTLMLIPLLGVHEVAFALVGEGQGGGTLCLVRLCLQLLLSSSQGPIVSILYCFINKEAEMRRGWHWCHLGAPCPPGPPPPWHPPLRGCGGAAPGTPHPGGHLITESCC
uniref:G-protein coupled receptors family 2 profile 2 domain-containing protein n=1 Tax=Aquila chrysaetos chrysaetos TaxID=223781 RepID=A0A663FL25_AQUCH